VREAFTEELKAGLEFLAQVMPGGDPARRSEDAIAAFAGMVGALILARAGGDATLSDLILKTTAKRLIDPSNLQQRAARRS